MGISRDNWHKRRKTGGKPNPIRKKRKFEIARPAANTKLAPRRVHFVRCRGGARKFRALRLDHGSYSWGSEAISRPTRILDVVYNACNNELVRTKTLVKGAIVLIDAAPFRQWYEAHYAIPLGRRKNYKMTEEEDAVINKKRSRSCQKKIDERKKLAEVEQALADQFTSGKLLASISSRPGQVGKASGYILEGKELEFYLRKLKTKKTK